MSRAHAGLVVWLLVCLAIAAVLWVMIIKAIDPTIEPEPEPARLISRDPLVCVFEAEDDGHLIGYECEVQS